MKKPYVKPMMAIERYELTQAVATCAIQISSTNSTCVLTDPDAPAEMKTLAAEFGMFTNTCGWPADDQSFGDGICYHTSVNQTFTS